MAAPGLSMLQRVRNWARGLKHNVIVLYLAGRDPRTPWPPRIAAALVAAYALSPIDLIPDFIPVLGMLDDLLIVPLGIWLVLRLLPPDLLGELRVQAGEMPAPGSRLGMALVIGGWTLLVALAWLWWSRLA